MDIHNNQILRFHRIMIIYVNNIMIINDYL